MKDMFQFKNPVIKYFTITGFALIIGIFGGKFGGTIHDDLYNKKVKEYNETLNCEKKYENKKSDFDKITEHDEEYYKERTNTFIYKYFGFNYSDDHMGTFLLNRISTSGLYPCNLINSMFTDKTFKASDIDNSTALGYAIRNYRSEFNKEGDSLSGDKVSNYIHSILGKDYKYKHGSYKLCPVKYDEENNKYIHGIPACGGTCGPVSIYVRFDHEDKTDNRIDYYVDVLFIGDNGYYSDYERKNLVVDKYSDEYKSFMNEYSSYYRDSIKGTKYKVVFELVDDDYIFVESSMVK